MATRERVAFLSALLHVKSTNYATCSQFDLQRRPSSTRLSTEHTLKLLVTIWWNLEFKNSCRNCIISHSSETIVVRLQLFALWMATSQAILGSSAICDLRGRSQSISHSSKNSIKQVLQAVPRSQALKAHSPAVRRLHTNLRVSHHLHPKRFISSLEDSCV